mmetsp:Transcript_21754/g.42793  ORF Transcript_21754/g.42793 Transcript_21754/m.42793 type:complete len:100 (-) Transcript_21754:769-1068(-)
MPSNSSVQNFVNIGPIGAELLQTKTFSTVFPLILYLNLTRIGSVIADAVTPSEEDEEDEEADAAAAILARLSLPAFKYFSVNSLESTVWYRSRNLVSPS